MTKLQTKGFSLIEILLSIATMAIIAGLSVPVYHSFQIRNNIDIMTDVIAQTLRRAQVLSQAVEGDSQWGASISSGGITLFKGSSFALRDIDFDETFSFSSSTISVSGLEEVIFSKIEGLPQSQGEINLVTTTGISKNLSINAKGIIDY